MPTTQNGNAGEFPAHLGVWTNWSRGPIFGATLTVQRREANLLIAFTAFFIAFVSTRTWRILCFILHRFYSRSDAQDAVYHQRQAILRNSTSPESGAGMLFMMLWSWRHSKRRLRPLLAMLVAILCIGVFTAAGGFSSLISSAVGNEVLIQSMNCGFMDSGSSLTDPERYFTMEAYGAETIDNAANYAQQCYSNQNPSLSECGRFIEPRLVGHTDESAGCPFRQDLCRTSKNIRLDTGLMDSNLHLGLNSPDNQKVLWRHVLHCAPLITKGFTSQNKTDGNLVRYHYGSYDGPAGHKNYVYEVEDVEAQYSYEGYVGQANYLLNVLGVVVRNGTNVAQFSDFVPIEPLNRSDADVNLVFLSGNGVFYLQPATDEWYKSGPAPFNRTVVSGDTQLYVPEEAASVLGCADQYQFCNSALHESERCGPLASLADAIAGAAPYFDSSWTNFKLNIVNSTTAARFQYFMRTFYSSFSSVVYVLQHLGPTALESQRSLIDGDQWRIAPNQWQLDGRRWWNISMAITQTDFVNTAYGPTDPTLLRARVNFTTPDFKKLCNNQIIESTGYASFSLFGLLFTFTTGLLIVLGSYLLEPISECLLKRNGYKQYAHLEWTANTTLQLQRLAHEDIGPSTWSKGTSMIPITAADEMLGTLDITDIRHPVLQRPSKGLSEITQAHIIPEITETASENIGRRDSSPGQSSPSSEATQRIIDTNEAEAEVYANSSMLSESRREDVIEIVGSDTAEGREDRSE